MSRFSLIAMFVCSCSGSCHLFFGRSDAREMVENAGGTPPIKCVRISGGMDTAGHYQDETFTCTDADLRIWDCDDEGCVQIKR